jgi:hypothetical protein
MAEEEALDHGSSVCSLVRGPDEGWQLASNCADHQTQKPHQILHVERALDVCVRVFARCAAMLCCPTVSDGAVCVSSALAFVASACIPCAGAALTVVATSVFVAVWLCRCGPTLVEATRKLAERWELHFERAMQERRGERHALRVPVAFLWSLIKSCILPFVVRFIGAVLGLFCLAARYVAEHPVWTCALLVALELAVWARIRCVAPEPRPRGEVTPANSLRNGARRGGNTSVRARAAVGRPRRQRSHQHYPLVADINKQDLPVRG